MDEIFYFISLQLPPWASLTLKRLMQVGVKNIFFVENCEKPGRKIIFSYGLVRNCDMEENMKKFVVEMCVSSLEKYSDNSQVAQIIKQKMDENFGGAGYWNVVVGESFDVGSQTGRTGNQ